MKTIKADVKFIKRASRLELIIRFFWVLIVNLILTIFSLAAGVLNIIHFLYILFLGRRHAGIQGFVKSVVLQRFYIRTYANFLTDERPPIIPKRERA